MPKEVEQPQLEQDLVKPKDDLQSPKAKLNRKFGERPEKDPEIAPKIEVKKTKQ